MMRNAVYSLLILIFFLSTLHILTSYARDSRSYGSEIRTIGEKTPEIVVLERQREVYHVWKARRFHGRVVFHFDTEMDAKPFNKMRPRFEYGIFVGVVEDTEEQLDDGNFMYYAMADGIVRKVVGVVQEGVFEATNEKDTRKSGYFNYGANYKGSVAGIPRIITTLNNIPFFEEPVLLDFDVKYFSRSDVDIEELFDKLETIRTDLVTFSMSEGEEGVTEEGIERMKKLIGLFRGAGRDSA